MREPGLDELPVLQQLHALQDAGPVREPCSMIISASLWPVRAVMPSLGGAGPVWRRPRFAAVGVQGGSGGVRLDPASCGCSWLSSG
jgi:hypothetical protein